MTLVKEYAVDYAFHSLVKRCIIKDDIGRFTTQFKRCFFIGSGNGTLNDLTYFC